LIEVKNLTKRYGNMRGVTDLNFTVEKGEVLGFLGPNGAGKSTTMNIITGYKPPTEGSVVIDGFDITRNPIEAKKRIGYLPEQPPIYPELSVMSYLKFVCELKGVEKTKIMPHIHEIMELVGIYDHRNRLIKNLSKGYKQRTGLAQALVSNPDVLVLDEPTVGLDPKQITEIRTLIKNLGRDHTIILSSHILAEISMICERVIIINKGEIAAIDTPKNLAKNIMASERFLTRIKGPKERVIQMIKNIDGVQNVKEMRLEEESETGFYGYIVENEKNADVKTPLFLAMARNGYIIHELRSLDVSLEDIFLQVTSEENENAEVH